MAFLVPMPAAQAQTPVLDLCPQATWTRGFNIGEFIPINPSQYWQSEVMTATPLRRSYGYEGEVVSTLSAGARLTIRGEVWDAGCNQWMAVEINGSRQFVHGHALRKL
ncbi:MAG: hypothetical protein HC929_06220 [Leptolyngbyaceae cyanobacterium SM2_5_2]|nr:hypothetical protein [Leptolyngbyaceae cyanobacterium SM2_5_2]